MKTEIKIMKKSSKIVATVLREINDLIEPGFRLTNANAKGSCGCGSSFSTGDPAPNVDVSFSV